MRIHVYFLILSIQFGFIFGNPPTTLGVPTQPNRNQDGYECGNVFFTDFEVKKAVSIARNNRDKWYNYPQKYQTIVFGEFNDKEYFLWPIGEKVQIPPYTKEKTFIFGVVLSSNINEAVYVVAKIPNNDYIKCIRRDNSHTEPSSSTPDISDGYLCGNEFLPDEVITHNHKLYLSQTEDQRNYLPHYHGNFYPRDSGYSMWSIVREENLYTHGTSDFGPYYLIINIKGWLMDVVVEGFQNNYLRCMRSKKPPIAPLFDLHSKQVAQPLKTGFACGQTFFDDEMLEINAEIVRLEVEYGKNGKRKAKHADVVNYPLEFNGYPYNQECWIWIMSNFGILDESGTDIPYYFVISKDYKAFSVGMIEDNQFKRCARFGPHAKKFLDDSDYNCDSKTFSYAQLEAAAHEACDWSNIPRRFRLLRYEGPEFMLAGPYFTYPIVEKDVVGIHESYAGKYRVVLTRNCEVVGALVVIVKNTKEVNKITVSRRLVKCFRSNDGEMPRNYFSRALSREVR